MNGIGFDMVFGALIEIAGANATLLVILAAIASIELAGLYLRTRNGKIRLRAALRWSIGFGVVAAVAIGYVLLVLTKAGLKDLHGWLDYAAWLLPTAGLAAGLGLLALPGFAALSARR